MEIIVNDNTYHYEATPSLFQVLEDLELNTQKGIAVAVNNEVILKKEWTKLNLKNQDRVLIITATQGG